MKNAIVLIFSLLLITSCAKYQYATLNSDLKIDNTNQFIYENDTVRVNYWFAGENCPVQIRVFNKIKTPIYVDWKNRRLL
jgi:uncharacterized protein YxeA